LPAPPGRVKQVTQDSLQRARTVPAEAGGCGPARKVPSLAVAGPIRNVEEDQNDHASEQTIRSP